MKKIVACFACMIVCLGIMLSGIMYWGREYVLAQNNIREVYMQNSELLEILKSANSIRVLIDNKQVGANSEDLLHEVEEMLHNYHEMPAFGVSLDRETRDAMKSGVWIEFEYNNEYSHNGMQFDKLTFEVNATHSGFNIMRCVNDKYEGRCFYINLDGDMSNLYDFLTQKN